MTAILAIVKKQSLAIYTDGAVYGPDNPNLLLARQKVGILFHQPCIMATRGEALSGTFLQIGCSEIPTFDELVDSMATLMRRAVGVGQLRGDRINLAVVFGGWSQRSGLFELYRMCIGGEALDRLIPGSLELERISSHTFEPLPPQEMLSARGLLTDGALDLRHGDDDIVRFMECQRAAKFQLGPRNRGRRLYRRQLHSEDDSYARRGTNRDHPPLARCGRQAA